MRVEQFGPSVGRLKPGHMRPSDREALRAPCFGNFEATRHHYADYDKVECIPGAAAVERIDAPNWFQGT